MNSHIQVQQMFPRAEAPPEVIYSQGQQCSSTRAISEANRHVLLVYVMGGRSCARVIPQSCMAGL